MVTYTRGLDGTYKISDLVKSNEIHNHHLFSSLIEDGTHPHGRHNGFGSSRSHDASDSDGIAAASGSCSRVGHHVNSANGSFEGAPVVTKGPESGRTDSIG